MLGLRELEGRSIVRGADSAAVSSAFHAALLDGHALEARALLVQAYLAGAGLADLCDGPIRSSLTLLGELWHHDQAGVFIEHRATAIVVEALSHLRTLLAVRSNAPVAVGCAPAGDPYVVPTLAASVALAGEGFDVTNLGPETPMLSLSLAIERLHPSLVWISASSAAGADAVVVASEPVLRAVERAGATLLVGGRLFESGSLPVAEGVAFGRTISDLVTFARGLQTRGVRGDGVVGA
jgi:methanogenic corrinoid protein MtbC1